MFLSIPVEETEKSNLGSLLARSEGKIGEGTNFTEFSIMEMARRRIHTGVSAFCSGEGGFHPPSIPCMRSHREVLHVPGQSAPRAAILRAMPFSAKRGQRTRPPASRIFFLHCLPHSNLTVLCCNCFLIFYTFRSDKHLSSV